MDYKERCRTCLGTCKVMRHIYSTVTIAGSDVCLSDVLHNFYDYKVSLEDEHNIYPENICINCVHHLTLTYSFKSLIHNTLRTLEENVNNVQSMDSDNFICEYDSDDYKPIIEIKIKSSTKRTRPKNKFTKKPHVVIKRDPSFEKQLFCVECKEEFHTFKALSDHCTDNHPVKGTVGRDCQYCSEKFEDFKELVIHRKLHVKPYLCLTCWTGFLTENEFKSHACKPNQHGRTTERVLRQCDQCGKSYPPGYIKIHMATHSEELKYSCKYCPKKFKVANGLNSHILWNHKRTRNHKCEVCDATFISASAKSSHIRKNHLKETKYGCESCAKRFFSKSELQRHTLTHTGVKNYHCHLCDKSYQTKHGLNVHLKSHANMNVNNVLVL